MTYGITKEELHPSLLEYIQSIAGSNQVGTSSFKYLKSNITLIENTGEVSIGISDYNKTTDLLLVYKNSVYIENSIDYNISSDSLKITSISPEVWMSGTQFNFICLKNVPELENYSINGSKIQLETISIDKLDSELQQLINSASSSDIIDGGTF